MSAPKPSRLDAAQIIQGAFDEETGRLRTDAQVSVGNADFDVDLDASEDSVAIADPEGDFLNINPDGSINVVLNGTSGTVLTSYYSEVMNVVSGITTLIGSYTASSGDLLQKVEFSGTNIAEFELIINGSTKDKKRTYFGNSLNGTFDFNTGLPVLSGQNIEVYVLHNRPSVGDFNARIQILGK